MDASIVFFMHCTTTSATFCYINASLWSFWSIILIQFLKMIQD